MTGGLGLSEDLALSRDMVARAGAKARKRLTGVSRVKLWSEGKSAKQSWQPSALNVLHHSFNTGFPCGSSGKESTCNAGDLVLIPGLGSEVKSISHVQLFATPWTVAHQPPRSMRFSRQEHWSGFPFPSPGDLPDPGIKPRSPALQADALTSEPPGNPWIGKIPRRMDRLPTPVF